MEPNNATRLSETLARQESAVLQAWINELLGGRQLRKELISESTLREQAREFLSAFRQAAQQGAFEELESPAWSRTRDVLGDIAGSHAKLGLSPTEVASFVFSLKRPLFQVLQKESDGKSDLFAKHIWDVTQVLDRLGLYTTELAMKNRQETIARQQAEMLELSTPVVKLWDGILALPLIGTLDSERTQIVMESLLEEIVRSGSRIAIIDITGVPTVDTLVAQHLLKTVAAARLMGAECIISGIRPQIASTIVHLGVNLGDVATKATLADAFAIALRRSDLAVVKISSARREPG
jgi:rsbT co-antagonist protein RsbR